ncbi:murein biosynthesis integral membrane protein MurJ [Patescibacteria group bacterium]|nr:murein biosynthesis integral membrane protein MurJ [Patescibacteria group bacterium]MCL5010049.1 murein biosynthesis integral membrane protein MurJ [Patescibacteria group bacterium]
MAQNLLQKGVNVLLKRQTNILSAAFIIMATVILSQILGLVRQRLLVAIFGASNTLGVYLASSSLPNFLFQLLIASAFSSAFIPIFSDYLTHGKEKEGHKMASDLFLITFIIFSILSLILFIFAPFFLELINLGSGFSASQMSLMTKIARIIIVGELIFMIGTFYSSLLQSYNHFFIPGIAAAFYNLGIILGIITLSSKVGIFAPAYGVILGSAVFTAIQFPVLKRVGFSAHFSFSSDIFKTPGLYDTLKLMWPRMVSIGSFQLGTILVVSLISFLPASGRSYVIFDYAQTLSFAPVILFGQTIAQAAFPVLSRERRMLGDFQKTFVTSFNQLLYLILPVSVLFLVLRIPIVRLVYGAAAFDWQATVSTGKTLAFFSIAISAQGLIYLVSRGFYALHDTKTPLIIGAISTAAMLILSYIFVIHYQSGVESLALASSLSAIFNLSLMLVFLDKRVGGFKKEEWILSVTKIITATVFTGFALYIPIKLLDQLVFDTTRTINLIILTGISSFMGLSLYLFLTWFLNVEEATTFILIFKKLGNWRDILAKSEEIIDGTRLTT